MGLEDFILEKRVNYINNIKGRIGEILVPDPLRNLKRLMLVPDDTPDNEIIETFIEKAKGNDYFKDLYNKIKDKEFSYETLKGLEEIAGETNLYYDSPLIMFAQVTSVIDRYFAPFLEPLRSLPLAYTSGEYPEGYSIEPNCVGANQIIAVLYSYDHDINDLKFLEVYSSKRRDNLLEKLKEIDNGKYSINFFEDFVNVDFDTFHGTFRKGDLKNMILDTALYIEENTHSAIKNKKTGEIYDYELEKENYKGVVERDIKEGIFYTTFANLLIMMDHLGYDKQMLKDSFNKYHKKFENSVLMNSVGLMLHFDEGKAFEFLEKIKEIYKNKEDLPAKYIGTEIILNLPYSFFDKKKLWKIKENIEFLKQKYILPNALDIISQRYLGDSSQLQNLYDRLR